VYKDADALGLVNEIWCEGSEEWVEVQWLTKAMPAA
jgi:hypothetical protein